MISAQTNYHLANKDSATAEFVSNMLQSEASNYLTNMSLTHGLSKMCWPNNATGLVPSGPPLAPQSQMQMHQSHHHLHHHHQQSAAAALAAGHNIEAILGSSYAAKIDSNTNSNNVSSHHKAYNAAGYPYMGKSECKSTDFNSSYDVDSSEEKPTSLARHG